MKFLIWLADVASLLVLLAGLFGFFDFLIDLITHHRSIQ